MRRAVTAHIPRIASRTMSTQIPKVGAGARAAVTWAFPVLVGVTWIIWPALDPEWLQEKGLGPDPEADLTMVHNARMARMEAYQKEHGTSSSEEKDEDADEEEEEEAAEEEAGEEDESGEDGEEEPAVEDSDDEESGDSEDADEEEEEESKAKPLFEPAKGTPGGSWDTFTVKSLNFGEDDDEDDDEDDNDGK